MAHIASHDTHTAFHFRTAHNPFNDTQSMMPLKGRVADGLLMRVLDVHSCTQHTQTRPHALEVITAVQAKREQHTM
eukprot:1161348-Pelagomonas_calceolata.AAC.5